MLYCSSKCFSCSSPSLLLLLHRLRRRRFQSQCTTLYTLCDFIVGFATYNLRDFSYLELVLWIRVAGEKGKAGLRVSGARRETFSSVFHNKMMIMYKTLRRNAGSGALEGWETSERSMVSVACRRVRSRKNRKRLCVWLDCRPLIIPHVIVLCYVLILRFQIYLHFLTKSSQTCSSFARWLSHENNSFCLLRLMPPLAAQHFFSSKHIIKCNQS